MFKKEQKEIPGTRLTPDGGVIKETLTEGYGAKPEPFHEVAVTYKGWWTNSEEDLGKNQSVQAPYRFIVGSGQVMPGWDIAVPTMRRGEKAKVTIEAKYASGWPSCPPYFPYDSKAQYEIEILDSYPKRNKLSAYPAEELVKFAETYKTQGKEHFLAGRLPHAMYCYYESLRFLDPLEKPLPDLRRTLKLNLAVCLFKRSEWKETAKLCGEILKETPGQTKALYLRGVSFAKLDKCEDAIKDLGQVVAATPDDTKAKAEFDRLMKMKEKQMPQQKKAHRTQYTAMFEEHKIYEDKPAKQKALPQYNPGNPRVFLNFQIGKETEPRKVVVELFSDRVPKTAENFRCLCTGEKTTLDPKLAYAGCRVLAVSKGFGLIAGDVENKVGGAESSVSTHSIYGKSFNDENFSTAHSSAGVLSMYNTGKDTNASQFVITFKACPELDDKQVVFGRVVSGMDTVKKLENLEVQVGGKPKAEVFISDCGAFPDPVSMPENCC